MFDRGLMSLDDDYAILMAKGGVPEPVLRLVNPDGRPKLPTRPEFRATSSIPSISIVRQCSGVNLKGNSGHRLLASLGGIRNVGLICTNHTCAKGGKPRDEQSRLSARYVLRFARQLK